MRRDSIFYRLFQQCPILLFDLISDAPGDRADYVFDSVEIKETSFRIDGVFLPPSPSGIVYFCEVQFQKDELLYERLVCEASLYFYRYRNRCRDWRVVAIYPSRSMEQSDLVPHQGMIDIGKLRRIYLDELGDLRQLPIRLSLMVLTTLEEEDAQSSARYLVQQAQEMPEESRAIIEMITTIMSYKFIELTRDEVEAMLGIQLEETGFYKSVKAEGILEGEQRGEAKIVLRWLERQLGELPGDVRDRVNSLAVEQLDLLAEAILDLSKMADLTDWLSTHGR
jgi:predicted transposase/invertase (TIGR01784 family)